MRRRFNITGSCNPQSSTGKFVQGHKFANDLLYAHQYNSPWNIAADFDIDMSFSASQIAEMIKEYEADNQTWMDIRKVAGEIYAYTSGYPVLVSSICKHIDENITGTEGFEIPPKAWSQEGVEKAVSVILKENPPHKDKGYMLSFNFNVKKETGVKEIKIGGRTIIEAVV